LAGRLAKPVHELPGKPSLLGAGYLHRACRAARRRRGFAGDRLEGGSARGRRLCRAVTNGSLHESGAGVRRPSAEKAHRPVHTDGSAGHRLRAQRRHPAPAPTSATRLGAFHRPPQGVNPDASRSLFAVGDSGAGVRHGRSGPGHHTRPILIPSRDPCSPPSLVTRRVIHRLGAELRNRRQLGLRWPCPEGRGRLTGDPRPGFSDSDPCRT